MPPRMDKEGVDVTVLYPTRGLVAHAKEYDDDGLAVAVSRAYNDWLADLCAPAPERMYSAAMLPAQCVETAVEEVKRTRQEYGFRAVFLRPNPVRRCNWNNPVYDPLWAECQEQDVAVGFHEGIPCMLPVAMGERFAGIHEDIWLTEHVASHAIEQMYACLSMIAGGVCERFPELRIAFLEGNCSWLPFWLWRMDEHYEVRERKLKKHLPLPPSEYFKRQFFAGVEADESLAVNVFDWMGIRIWCSRPTFRMPTRDFPTRWIRCWNSPFPRKANARFSGTIARACTRSTESTTEKAMSKLRYGQVGVGSLGQHFARRLRETFGALTIHDIDVDRPQGTEMSERATWSARVTS